MRPDVVVVIPPESQRSAGVGQAVEDLLVEAFVAQAAVEGLDVAVLLRFAGVDVMPLDLVVVRPFQDGLADELGPVVRNYAAGGFSIDPDESVQFLAFIFTFDTIGSKVFMKNFDYFLTCCFCDVVLSKIESKSSRCVSLWGTREVRRAEIRPCQPIIRL